MLVRAVMKAVSAFLHVLLGIGGLCLPLVKKLVVRLIVIAQQGLRILQDRYAISGGSIKKFGIQTAVVFALLLISRGTLLASNQPNKQGLIEDSTPATVAMLETLEDSPADIVLAEADLERLFLDDIEESTNPNPEDGYTSEQDAAAAPAVKPLRKEIIQYAVKDGDTVSSIAQEFEISPSTVLWANNLMAISIIRPGQNLVILPVSGITYTVKANDTLQKIAGATRSDMDAIRSINNVSDTSLIAGTTLIIPNGRPAASIARIQPRATPASNRTVRLPSVDLKNIAKIDVKGIAGLLWPTTLKGINQYFTRRHVGVDIKGRMGNPIYATDSGEVALAGWNRGGYGQQVVLKHDNGTLSRYAHMSKILVSPRETVDKGQVIGLVGSTGRSTGPHLHFEVLVKGARVNPLKYF